MIIRTPAGLVYPLTETETKLLENIFKQYYGSDFNFKHFISQYKFSEIGSIFQISYKDFDLTFIATLQDFFNFLHREKNSLNEDFELD